MKYTDRDIARAREELESVKSKAERLRELLLSEADLSNDERALMMEQLQHMNGYVRALKGRIDLMLL